MANFNGTVQHVENPTPIRRRVADMSFPSTSGVVPVVTSYSFGTPVHRLDRKAPFRIGAPETPTNHHASIVTIRTCREAVVRALNDLSSAGHVPSDLNGWEFLNLAKNDGLRTRFFLENLDSPMLATIDLPDVRHAVPEVPGENFVAAAHLDLPEYALENGEFPREMAALAESEGFRPVARTADLPASQLPYVGHVRMSRAWTAYKPANARGLVAHTLALLSKIVPQAHAA